jgi:NADH-quinone oxidoreductase subunit A
LSPYVPLVLMMLAAAGVAALLLGIKRTLGPRNPTAVKLEPFECGNPPVGSPRRRFDVKFYGVALLFILFDIESVFLFPWAALYRELGWTGFAEMALFIGMLVVGLVYVWSRGALDWLLEADEAERRAESRKNGPRGARAEYIPGVHAEKAPRGVHAEKIAEATHP